MSASPPIVIMGFTGEQPRVISRLLPDNGASSAIDTRLDDGGLTPMRDTPIIDNVGIAATWQSIYLYQGDWIGWDIPNVCAAPGPVAQDRLYYTGDGGVPKMRIGTTIFNLAVPRPTVKLTTTLTGSPSATPTTYSRSYIYSFVAVINGITEESEPSPPSTIFDWKTGQGVDLSGFQLPSDPARGITLQRIYRLQTGTAGTYFYLIAERAVSTANYSDTIPIDKLAEPCPSITYNAPPVDLQGLIAMPNGMMAAFGGDPTVPASPSKPVKRLYFCEPYKPHAWPEVYSLTTEHNIVGLGAVGNSLVVATDAHPYLVVGTSPASMIMNKLEHNLPCVNSRSVVDLGYAIAYVTQEGLAIARADGSIGIATSVLFTRENWEDYHPDEVICAQLNGRFVMFYSRRLDDGTTEEGAMFFDLGNTPFLFRTASVADAVFYSVERSALYFKPRGKGEIREIDADNAGRRILYWRSKEFVLPYGENYGAFRVDGDVDTAVLDQTAYDALIATATANNLVLVQKGGTYDWTGDAFFIDPPPAPPAAAYWHYGYHLSCKMDPPPYYPAPAGQGENASIGGDLNSMEVNARVANGDILELLPYQPVSIMTCGIYCDKQLVGSATEVNKAVRLPSGFRGRTWEVDVFTNQRVHRIAMTKNMDDMKRLP